MNPGRTNLVRDLAGNFWKEACITPIYPLAATLLEQAICLLLPINIVRLNKLTTTKAAAWLSDRNFKISLQGNEPLYGLLFIHRGNGLIFLNGTVKPDEQCYTLAHELGHYLVEFEHPRKRAKALHGDLMEEVFAGTRAPSAQEELAGVLKQSSVSPYLHLLEEEHLSAEGRLHVWNAENMADAMAFELLAPFARVFTEVNAMKQNWTFTQLREEVTELLLSNFCLPKSAAIRYATAFAYRLFPHGNGLIERLKSR